MPLNQNAGAFARTLGVRRAPSEFVAFADDDSWWAPGSLAAAVEIFDDEPDVAVSTRESLSGPENRLDPVCTVMAESPLPRPDGSPLPSLLGFVACAAVVRRSAFLSVGGFDEVVRFPGRGGARRPGSGRGRLADGVRRHPGGAPPSVAAPPLAGQAGGRRHPLGNPDGDDAALGAACRPPDVERAAVRARGRQGLYAALRDVPGAVRARRVVGSDLQRAVDLLAASQ